MSRLQARQDKTKQDKTRQHKTTKLEHCKLLSNLTSAAYERHSRLRAELPESREPRSAAVVQQSVWQCSSCHGRRHKGSRR